MMTKVKPINLGYHVTDYDTFLSRERLSDDKVLFLSAQPYDWFPLELIETEQAHQADITLPF